MALYRNTQSGAIVDLADMGGENFGILYNTADPSNLTDYTWLVNSGVMVPYSDPGTVTISNDYVGTITVPRGSIQDLADQYGFDYVPYDVNRGGRGMRADGTYQGPNGIEQAVMTAGGYRVPITFARNYGLQITGAAPPDPDFGGDDFLMKYGPAIIIAAATAGAAGWFDAPAVIPPMPPAPPPVPVESFVDMTGFYTPDILSTPAVSVTETVINPAALPFNPATDFLIDTAPVASDWTALTAVNDFGQVVSNPLPDYYSGPTDTVSPADVQQPPNVIENNTVTEEPLQGGAEGAQSSDSPSPSPTNTPNSGWTSALPSAGTTASILSTAATVAKTGAGLLAALMSGTAAQHQQARAALLPGQTLLPGGVPSTVQPLSPGLEIAGKVIPWPLVIAGAGLIYSIAKD